MICNKKDCVGCFACYNICPKNAISMIEDEHGFIYPKIDDSKCVNCGMCHKVCQANHQPQYNKIKKCYGGFVKDLFFANNCASGGIASILAKKIIEDKGIVYGCSFEKGYKIHHIRITKEEEIFKLKGSKYVHSYVDNSYKLVKDDLRNDKTVLFIGTPCQISGLKYFLGNIKTGKLFLVDIICHGVPSQKYLKDEIGELAFEANYLNFRPDGKFIMLLKDDDKIICSKKDYESQYYTGFLDSVFYRENCYNCHYACNDRVSDITIGDFWGLPLDDELRNKKRNVSIILINTSTGEELFDKIKNYLTYSERDISNSIKNNPQLNAPAIMKREYFKFYNNYCKYGFVKAFNKTSYFRMKKKKLKSKLQNNRMVYSLYQKLKGGK